MNGHTKSRPITDTMVQNTKTNSLKEFIKENYIVVFDLEELLDYIKINNFEEPIRAIPDKIKKEFGDVKIQIKYDDDPCLCCIIVTILLDIKKVTTKEEARKAAKKGTKIDYEISEEFPHTGAKIVIGEKMYEYI